jgi:hypothetical protein
VLGDRSEPVEVVVDGNGLALRCDDGRVRRVKHNKECEEIRNIGVLCIGAANDRELAVTMFVFDMSIDGL